MKEIAHLHGLKNRGFSLKGGKILGHVDLRNTRFDVPGFRLSTIFENALDISDSQFSGNIDLRGSTFQNGLIAARTIIHGSLMIGDTDDSKYDAKREAKGSPILLVKAPHIRVSGDVVVAAATIEKEIDISNAQISGSATFMYVSAAYVNLSATDIGNQLIFYNCIIHPSETPHGGYRDLNLYSVRTKQSVYINRVSLRDEIFLEGAEINGDLILLGTELSSMNARSSKISGSMNLGLHPSLPTRWTKWKDKSVLDLTSARLGGFRSPERLDVWPKNIYFHNLSYSFFSADHCGVIPCNHSAMWFGQWLTRQADERKTFEPYKAAFDILLGQGHIIEAHDLAVLGHDVERADAYDRGEISRYILLSVYRQTVGYGYKLYWIFGWILFFIVLGAFVFRQTPEAQEQKMPVGIFYSFDLLVPIVRLRESHYKIDLKGPARYYFYFHKLVGWGLSLVLIAAVSGAIK